MYGEQCRERAYTCPYLHLSLSDARFQVSWHHFSDMISLLRFDSITKLLPDVANTTATACPSNVMTTYRGNLTRIVRVKLQWQCLSSVPSFYLSSARFIVSGLRTWQRPGTPRYNIIHKSLEHFKKKNYFFFYPGLPSSKSNHSNHPSIHTFPNLE